MKRILILGAGSIQVPIITKCKELSLYTIVADYDAQAPGLKYADETYIVSTNDKEGVLEIARKSRIDGILTTSDYPVNVVAYVSKELGLSSMSEETAKLCTNKYFQREFLKENRFKYPQFYCMDSLEGIDRFWKFPYIVKPVDSSASRGVRKVNSREELIDQFEIARSNSRSGEVIVEEFIEGKEYSVETFSQHGKHHVIQITEKLIIGEEAGYFVEDTHIEPALLTDLEKGKIEKTVCDILSGMKVDNCPTHTELKINSDGIFIIETACRLGGDYITSDLVPLSTGIDMLGNLIRVSLGLEIDVQVGKNKISAVQFLNDRNYDRCVSFIEKKNPSVVRYEINSYDKHQIKCSTDRLGYIILNTDSRSEMNEILAQIK